ncbi:ABC transporter ATP-binding protein [bacterium]|nr:ABC transporter ATP-binding protein [bacterium]MCK4437408.1 ABC transporter ATP-binding protein [bacterium]
MSTRQLLEVQNLKMYYQTSQGYVKAVDDISFQVEKGETVGLVGESGCGKTSVAISILRILPSNGRILGGRILFKGEDLFEKEEAEMRKIRWQCISMIFQAAMNALNPVYRVGDQIAEAIRVHQDLGRKEIKERVRELYQQVGMDPSRWRDYPHQYSGGMKQRAIIAMALACNPELVIADEPTTALDVIVQDQIMEEISKLQRQLGMAMIYISHDISILTETCNRMGIMYAGKLIEYGETASLFRAALHPYTQSLLASYPNLKGEKRKLSSIPGEPPCLVHPPPGCRFHPRCNRKKTICEKEEPGHRPIKDNHWAACHLLP